MKKFEASTSAEGNTSVAAASVKVPPFWVEDPEMWFAQLEGQFHIAGVVQDATKFAYVIGNLEGQYAKEVSNVIKWPPESGKYDTIKKQLIERLSQLEDEKRRQLLESEELGDRTPSQFLVRLRSLAGSSMPDELLRSIWCSRLPRVVRNILATQGNASFEDATVLADKVHELTKSNATFASLEWKMDGLAKKVEELMWWTHRSGWQYCQGKARPMTDSLKNELRKEIIEILRDADLTTTSARKVREQIEEKLDMDLSDRKKDIDDLVMEYLRETQDGGKRKKKAASEESEDGDEEEEEGFEVEKPAKRSPAEKSGFSSDEESASDEDWAKIKMAPWRTGKEGGGRAKGASTRPIALSPELTAVVGSDRMARHEVVKKVWNIIKERDLFDPENKQFAICDDELMKVIGVKRFRTFGMMKYLKKHFVD